MIVYDLACAEGHRFEGWFASSADFERQNEERLIACPLCNSTAIAKAPMAPALGSKRNSAEATPERTSASQMTNVELPPQVKEAFANLAKAQAKALSKSTWVGEKFAEEVRSQHYGDKEEVPVHGKATLEDAKSLSDEGIAVAPLLFPVADPDELN